MESVRTADEVRQRTLLNRERHFAVPVVSVRWKTWVTWQCLPAVEVTLEKFVAFAVLMPIVASMGGFGDSQTLTLAIRGLAMGQINASNSRWLLFKKVATGSLNALVWVLVVAVIAVIWYMKDVGNGWTLMVQQDSKQLGGIDFSKDDFGLEILQRDLRENKLV